MPSVLGKEFALPRSTPKAKTGVTVALGDIGKIKIALQISQIIAQLMKFEFVR